MRNTAEALEQLFLPAECLLCHALLFERDTTHVVCPVCRHRWRPVRPPWCERCGQPEPHFGPCRLCAEWPAALTAVRSAVWLADGAREAVHAMKYGGLPRIDDDLAAAMAKTAGMAPGLTHPPRVSCSLTMCSLPGRPWLKRPGPWSKQGRERFTA